MRFSLREKVMLLEFVLTEMAEDGCEVMLEAMTPYQKAQQRRRQTIATHTSRPAKQSTFYKHAVRAIFQKLRKDGESFSGAAKGGQRIAQHMLKKHGYAQGQESGSFKLTSKGRGRNKKHTSEPSSVRKKKGKAYDYIMGIQRRKKKRKEQVQKKAASAG